MTNSPVFSIAHLREIASVMLVAYAFSETAWSSDTEKESLAYLPILRIEREGNQLTPGGISWGGQLKAFPLTRFNRDLREEKKLDQAFVPIRLELGLSVPIAEKLDLYFSTEIKDTFWFEGDGQVPTEIILENARFNIRDVGTSGLSLSMGRMTIQDRREAILRAQYDGLLLTYEDDKYRIDIGGFSRGKVRSDLLHSTDGTHNTDIIARFETRMSQNVHAGLLLINMNDHTIVQDDRTYVAVRSHGQLFEGLTHWLELTHLTGSLNGRKRHAWASEVRALYEIPATTPAQIGVSYLWASGDKTPEAATLKTFRQTGLQRNNSFWEDGPKYRLLGEALRADVSNLHAISFMFRFFPSKNSSLSILWHSIWQDQANPHQFGWTWGGNPNGIDKKLASEFDITAGLKLKGGLSLELNGAYVVPGAAFGESATDGISCGLELRYKL